MDIENRPSNAPETGAARDDRPAAASEERSLDHINSNIHRLLRALGGLEGINVTAEVTGEDPLALGHVAPDEWYISFEVERTEAVWASLDLLAGLDDRLYEAGLFETGAYITITLWQPATFQMRGYKVDANLITDWIVEANP